MLGIRAWGLLVCTVAVSCGGNAQKGQPGSQPTPSGAGTANATGGALNGNGGATTQPPKPAAGGVAGSTTTNQGGEETSGGEGPNQGGAETGPCAGVVPRCLPAEPVCDPVRGKLTTCSDCGEPLPGGETACVRIIASDKESNGVCVVRANDQLTCWAGWGQGDTKVLPTDVVELVLGDDFASAQTPLTPCVRRSNGEYSCLSGAKDSLRVAIGDSGLCAIFSNHELYCEGSINEPALVVPSPIDVAITDSSAFVLGAIGLATMDLPARLPTFWKGTPAKVLTDHQSAGCLISDLSELACWISLTEAMGPSPWHGKYRKLVPATMPRACVLDDDRQLRCGDIFADSEPAPLGSNDVVDFTASATTVCSLSVAGRVRCWNAAGEPLDVPEGW